ncbi:unnamed protein product [Amoebophrya sp. A25]|nr:unnamed protein product [Amoebophrya sp. A25]|eukprot:GSA25T00015044001.1
MEARPALPAHPGKGTSSERPAIIRLIDWYNGMLAKYPFQANAYSTAVIGAFADILRQFVERLMATRNMNPSIADQNSSNKTAPNRNNGVAIFLRGFYQAFSLKDTLEQYLLGFAVLHPLCFWFFEKIEAAFEVEHEDDDIEVVEFSNKDESGSTGTGSGSGRVVQSIKDDDRRTQHNNSTPDQHPVSSSFSSSKKSSESSSSFILALQKVCVEEVVFAPVFNLVFLTCEGVLRGETALDAIKEYGRKFRQIQSSNMIFWFPVNLGTFWLVPPKLRLLFVNMMNILWMVYLSMKSKQK